MRDLSVRQLKLFLKLTETGSFTETAHIQGVSQPALSRAVKEMEQSLGAQLFDRNARGVSLTLAGLHLLPIAKHIVAEFDCGFSTLAESIKVQPTRLIIASIDSMMRPIVAPALASFRQSHPHIELSLVSGVARDIVEAVISGRAEIGFTLRPGADARLVYTAIGSDDLMLVCRPEESLANRESVAWEDLSGRGLVTLNSRATLRTQIDNALNAADIQPASVVECHEFSHMDAFLAHGLGVAVVPRSALVLLRTELIAIPILPAVTRQFGVITRGDRPLTLAAARLIDMVSSR